VPFGNLTGTHGRKSSQANKSFGFGEMIEDGVRWIKPAMNDPHPYFWEVGLDGKPKKIYKDEYMARK